MISSTVVVAQLSIRTVTISQNVCHWEVVCDVATAVAASLHQANETSIRIVRWKLYAALYRTAPDLIKSAIT